MKLSESTHKDYIIYTLKANTPDEVCLLKKFEDIADPTVMQFFVEDGKIKLWFADRTEIPTIGSILIEPEKSTQVKFESTK